MLLSLALVGVALRLGLRIRRARAARRPAPRGTREAHLRVAKIAVVLLAVGLLAGPASAVWLRGWEVIGTLHGLIAIVTAGLFACVAFHGRRLERGHQSARSAHAWFAAFAVLAACVTAVAGFVLLP